MYMTEKTFISLAKLITKSEKVSIEEPETGHDYLWPRTISYKKTQAWLDTPKFLISYRVKKYETSEAWAAIDIYDHNGNMLTCFSCNHGEGKVFGYGIRTTIEEINDQIRKAKQPNRPEDWQNLLEGY